MSDREFVGLGVDVGGTFTDAVVLTAGEVTATKRPTTPDDQSIGAIAAAMAALDAAGLTASQVTRFVHGMTVSTNALIEEKVARTALVATAGFEDLEELGRQNRPSLYNLDLGRPAPLTNPADRIGARERATPAGILTLLDESELVEAINGLPDEIAAVAVTLLFSFRHPEHELKVAEIVQSLRPGVHVSLSHEVVGTFREYERCSTTVTDAAVTPLVKGYLERLRDRAVTGGLPEPVIMLSNGGTATLALASARGSLTVLSGPAGGAAGAANAAKAIGLADTLCLDMGGTSTDVSLVQAGATAVTSSRGVGGRHLALPAVDIVTVGAGGGSIGWADDAGGLAVGPRSAGANPGPAAYGRSGREATVTDANLVLGYLADGQEFGAEIKLDAAAARQAVDLLATRLGMSLEQAAAGIVRLANTEMAGALRQVSVTRGVDPRTLALIAFGGAAGLHCAALANELEIDRVHCPSASGTLSALGMLQAPMRSDAAQSVVRALDAIDEEELLRLTKTVANRARSLDDLQQATISFRWELRYQGQSHELIIEGDFKGRADLRSRFEQLHEQRYGYAAPDRSVELVTVRATAEISSGAPNVEIAPGVRTPKFTEGHMWFDGLGWTNAVRVADPASRIVGPAAIDLPDTTVIVLPGWLASITDCGIDLERAA